ncbi:Kinesin motor domain [Carpediemonas membranifera]|uniref:Kinesin-like protein n=1 Tax=Carpediemonas membranifera TaxID=201153 RepID=A0A8J6AWG9_9EUKA|nr:Kinesin motor domain [Carpediemonas membranifera]|eukprot:KAG9394235.1 Kinesin motor domain [Carpediemonas membranifera]
MPGLKFPKVYEWLANVELDHLYNNFEEQSIDEEAFLQLMMEDYSSLGITNMKDKQKLFCLVQMLKQESNRAEDGDDLIYDWGNDFSPVQHKKEDAMGAVVKKRAPVPVAMDPAPGPAAAGRFPTEGEFLDQLDSRIRVVVRKRPMNRKEMDRKEMDIAECCNWDQVQINEPKVKVDLTKYTEHHQFMFDQVFDEETNNQEVYFYTARPLVSGIFSGGHATCFAYGQTGAGKTFTMMGRDGIYVLAAKDIFTMLTRPEYQHLQAEVAFFEIYGGKLFDLLNKRKRLWAREDAKGTVCIAGLREEVVADCDRLMRIIDYGLTSRSVGATGVNADSSRSHAILQITLRAAGDPSRRIHGRISFIDLAGSERAADTMDTNRQTRMEGAEINKSLLALKECIRALDKKSGHTPFRGSKLTMVLKDSFVGNAQTVMIANISPNSLSCENTLNTLRYADRVKEIQSRKVPGRGRPNMDKANKLDQLPPMGEPQEPRDVRAHEPEIERDPLSQTHEDIVDHIYMLEDDIMEAHRQEVDQMMNLVKDEVALLHDIEQSEDVDLDRWVGQLEEILQRKQAAIGVLQGKLVDFKRQLQLEEQMSRSLEFDHGKRGR